MKRMKTFFIYLILFVLLFFGVRFFADIGIRNTYKNMNNYEIKTESPIIKVTESKKTNVNGYIEGELTNNTEQYINNINLKATFYNKDNEVIGIKGIPIENFKQLDTLEYRLNYRYSNVERIELELTEDPVENIEIESDLVNFTFDNRKVIWFIAGLIVLWNIPGWIF